VKKIKAMKIIKVYLDTSVVSMLNDSEQGIITRNFFDFAIQKGYQFVVSEVVKTELNGVLEETKRETILNFLDTLNCLSLPYSKEAYNLAWTYVVDEILTENHFEDLLHVAYATVHDCDVIISWNRRHIANQTKIQKLNLCNIKNNLRPIAIYTPQDFLTLNKEF
jgi:predicted nucleic acid-binding protein